MRVSAILVVSLLCVAVSVASAQQSSFHEAQLVPDILDDPPPASIDITYPSGVAVQNGNELTPTQVKEMPKVSWEANPNKFYTLIMSDPDAPSRTLHLFREVRHWLVVNVPGNRVSDGETISGYMGSGPPEGTGLHRYVFLVYEQSGGSAKLTFDEKMDLTGADMNSRMKFSTKGFATKYNLGTPIAGNFFQAKWDESVPRLADQLAALKARGIDLSGLVP